MHIRKVVILYLLFILFTSPAGASALYSKLQNRLKHIKTLSGTFTQKTYMKDIDKSQTFEGRFYIKSPDRMKWVYTLNSNDVVYILGDKMIIYQPSENQAFVTKTDRMGISASPMKILLGSNFFDRDFIIKEEKNSIILIPRRGELLVKKIKLTLSSEDGLIKRIELVDTSDNRTIIEIRGYIINPKIDNSLFQFTPPKGTTIINQ